MEENLWTCVYDTSHKLRFEKFNLHLANCRARYVEERRRNGLPLEIGICGYSSLHHIHYDQMKVHEATCEEKPKITLKASLKWGLEKKTEEENSEESDVVVYLSPVVDVGPDAPPVKLEITDKKSRIRWYVENPTDVDDEEWRSLDLSGKLPATKTQFTTQIETLKQYWKRKAEMQLANTSVSLAVQYDDLPGPSRRGVTITKKPEVIKQKYPASSSSVIPNAPSIPGTRQNFTAPLLDLTSPISNSPHEETEPPVQFNENPWFQEEDYDWYERDIDDSQ